MADKALPYKPISEMPAEYRDGREVLLCDWYYHSWGVYRCMGGRWVQFPFVPSSSNPAHVDSDFCAFVPMAFPDMPPGEGPAMPYHSPDAGTMVAEG